MEAATRIRFADGPLDDVAHVLCGKHARAAEYLSQAPALAVLACGKFGSHITYGEVDAFTAIVGGEPRLRDLLQAYSAPLPMRRLSERALRMRDRAALLWLAKLDPSTLSQVIPGEAGQCSWLGGLRQWLRLEPSSKKARKQFSVAWIARRLAEDQGRVEQLDALIDFVARGGGQILECWSWARAVQAVADWHKRLNDETALHRALEDEKRRADFDKVICKARLPDFATVDGMDFTVLRTARTIRDEGVAMHHCVASYAGSVKRGACAIVSVSKGNVRVATLEISRKGTVAQLKSHCNGTPPPTVRAACEMYALQHWRSSDAEQPA